MLTKLEKKQRKSLNKFLRNGARKEYCKGWRLKKDKLGKNRYTIKVHNKTDYQLTHLLEFGHATRNGGRTKAQPHIRKVEQEYSQKFEQKLRTDIGGLK